MKNLFWLVASLYLTSCSLEHELAKRIDLKSFYWLGGTLFSEPLQVTVKEIHLDGGTLQGRTVVLEGKIVEWGKYKTYLVLSDDSANMLVLLSDLNYKVIDDLSQSAKSIRILGVIESDKKGLPLVHALALRDATG